MSYVIDTATPKLLNLIRGLRDREKLNLIMSRAAANLVKDHFAALAGTNKNKFGVRSTFWKRMRQATRSDANPVEAAVVMPREVAQRRFGGVLRPKGGRKMLAIPISKDAYGKSPLEFDDLHVVRLKDKNQAFLVRFRGRDEGINGPSKSDKMQMLYVLKSSVSQLANPAVLPTDAEFEAVINKAIREYVRVRLGGAA